MTKDFTLQVKLTIQVKPTISSQPETGVQNLNGEKQGDRIIPNSEDSIKLWSDIWSIKKENNQHV